MVIVERLFMSSQICYLLICLVRSLLFFLLLFPTWKNDSLYSIWRDSANIGTVSSRDRKRWSLQVHDLIGIFHTCHLIMLITLLIISNLLSLVLLDFFFIKLRVCWGF